MQVVSTGLSYLIVPVQSGLQSARISHPRFEGLLDASGAKFVYVLDPDRPEGRTWDNADRVEDVATGSAACLPPATCCTTASVPPENPSWSTRAGSPGGPARSRSALARTAGLGRRAGSTCRGWTLPRPSDLTAAPPPGDGPPAPAERSFRSRPRRPASPRALFGVAMRHDGHAGTTYGKFLFRRCLDTDGFSPEGTAVLTTRDSIASGALSASVRPLRAAKL